MWVEKKMINNPKSLSMTKSNLYIVGDSLAQTFSVESYPMQGWGAFLGEFFKSEMNIHNYAKSGWSTKSFLTKGYNEKYPDQSYWEIIKEQFKAGDWLLIGLGINDCSLDNEMRTTESEYRENLIFMSKEARDLGVKVIFITQTIRGGEDNSEKGWQYILPSDNVLMDESIPMEMRWVRRAKVLTDIGEEIGIPVIQLGKFLSEHYEKMYQNYMSLNPKAKVADGRNFVRYYFHIYKMNNREDDSTHTNINGAREIAKIIAKLILKTDSALARYLSIDKIE